MTFAQRGTTLEVETVRTVVGTTLGGFHVTRPVSFNLGRKSFLLELFPSVLTSTSNVPSVEQTEPGLQEILPTRCAADCSHHQVSMTCKVIPRHIFVFSTRRIALHQNQWFEDILFSVLRNTHLCTPPSQQGAPRPSRQAQEIIVGGAKSGSHFLCIVTPHSASLPIQSRDLKPSLRRM